MPKEKKRWERRKHPIYCLIIEGLSDFKRLKYVILELERLDNPPLIINLRYHIDKDMENYLGKKWTEQKASNYHSAMETTQLGSDIKKLMDKFTYILQDSKPKKVVVQGDGDSAMACALVAKHMGVKVAHIDAGKREVLNYEGILIDSVSTWLFVSNEEQTRHLMNEGISESKIHVIGDYTEALEAERCKKVVKILEKKFWEFWK